MKKLTKREALRMCRKLWLWLAAHPGKSKRQAFKALGLPAMFCDCPCCEYEEQNYGDASHCEERCLLKDLWPDNCVDTVDSPYLRWLGSNRRDTSAAMQIADACKKKR